MSHPIYTVSELNRETALLLNDHFLSILVEGEISNLSIPASGHCYFTLKDAFAQVRCALFKSQQRRHFKPENGKHVIVKAQVSLYEPRGDFQLIVDHIEEAGIGALQRAFDELTKKLAAEGLFLQEHKKTIPALPKTIGIITSPSGAAVHDILTVLRRRFAAIPVIIYPTAVQGEMAKYEICQALATANAHQDCDVLILARGGGSLEDLWAFNEEMVARAIFASQIPVISGIGHETDVTIADFVADLRAATPSAAAESATPNAEEWLIKFNDLSLRLAYQLQRQLRQEQQKLDWLSGRLAQQHPKQRMARNQERLGELETRLHTTMQQNLTTRWRIVETKTTQVWQLSPTAKIRAFSQQQTYLKERLMATTRANIMRHQQRFASASQTLNAVSPLATLNRGYTLVSQQTTGQLVKSISQVKVGDKLFTQVADGKFISQVEGIINSHSG